jgi:hypothetical protein
MSSIIEVLESKESLKLPLTARLPHQSHSHDSLRLDSNILRVMPLHDPSIFSYASHLRSLKWNESAMEVRQRRSFRGVPNPLYNPCPVKPAIELPGQPSGRGVGARGVDRTSTVACQ